MKGYPGNRAVRYGLLAAAGLALWLLLAGPGRVLGLDPGQIGMALLVATTWIALYFVRHASRDERGQTVSPGEWRAWIGVGFMAVAVAYFLARLDLFTGPEGMGSAHARAVARNLVMLGIAWAVLGQVLAARWKGQIQEDERDREIARRAAHWGYGALVFCVIALAVTLGFSPAHRLQWASHFLLANLLVLVLMLGWLCEYAATAVYYWRDRR
jgi:hypothetical protein